MPTDLVIPARFRGPARSGNGGYAAGALAGLLASDAAPHEPITVVLRSPPPLDTPMAVAAENGEAVAALEDRIVARASHSEAAPTPVPPVPADQARAAEEGYPGLVTHPFPTCFSCGPGRGEGDGLRIFPGPVAADAVTVAATWTPHPSVGPSLGSRHAPLAVTWAALDCIGGWAGDVGERPMVLGTMTARVDALPGIGEEHVVVGHSRGEEGRKAFTASTLYDADGRVIATAEHVWIRVDPDAFNYEPRARL